MTTLRSAAAAVCAQPTDKVAQRFASRDPDAVGALVHRLRQARLTEDSETPEAPLQFESKVKQPG